MRFGKGFSLIELLIAMSVLAIAAMMVAPSFAGYNRATKVKTAATSVQVEMQKARLEAIKRNASVGVDFITGTPNQVRLFQDKNNNGTYDATDPLITTVAMDTEMVYGTTATGIGPEGTTVGSSTTATFPGLPPTLVYTRNGTVLDTAGVVYNGAVYLRMNDAAIAYVAPEVLPEYALTVGRFGAIQMYRYDGLVWREK